MDCIIEKSTYLGKKISKSLAVCVQKIMTFWIFFLPDFIISSSMEIVLERMGWDYLIFSLAREHSLTSKGEVSLYGWPPVWLVWIWPNLLIWIIIQHKQSSWIQTSQTEGQPYSDTSPYKVSEYSLPRRTCPCRPWARPRRGRWWGSSTQQQQLRNPPCCVILNAQQSNRVVWQLLLGTNLRAVIVIIISNKKSSVDHLGFVNT